MNKVAGWDYIPTFFGSAVLETYAVNIPFNHTTEIAANIRRATIFTCAKQCIACPSNGSRKGTVFKRLDLPKTFIRG
jgi:hypothetical protein